MFSVSTIRSVLSILVPWLSRLVSLTAVVILVGLIPEIAGIDPSQSILRARSGQQQLLTAESLQAVRTDLQLHRSAFERLIDWFSGLIKGDLGVSWIDGSSVTSSIQKALSTSLFLMSTALILTFILCSMALIRMLRLWKKGTLKSNHHSLSIVFISLPEYVIASLLILFFSIWLGWFPPYGWQSWQNIWLPSLALALPASGLFSRLLHDSLLRVFNEPWITTWLSANVHTNQIIRFALKKALSSLIPQISMIIIGITGGAVAVEQIFSIPGIGRLILSATKAQDLPILQGGLLVLLFLSIMISSFGLLLQQLILGHSLKSGKLISSHSSFQLTKSAPKRMIALSILSFLLLIAVWALFRDPYSSQFSRLASPNIHIPLGADGIGRDLLARIGAGMISTFQAGILATFLSLLTGIVMGFNTRWTQGLIEVTKGVPYIVAGLLVAGISGMNANSALIAIVLVSWAPLAAHCSSLIVEAKAQPYTHLAPTWGTNKLTIFRFYLLPYVLPPLLRHTLLKFPVITLSLTSLSFIGLGAKPPESEWGLMIAENLPYIERAPLGVLGPIFGLILMGIAINLLFDD
ncbi:transporter [Aliivibrio sp. 1S165]|uniref:ABC transporter permease subunit n=1 Tax=unclassified Aliivibrio TaxID=2645654 RepID=UPI00080DAF5D|nr:MULTISPECIES: ABC transporter permease subunit [unclassified Aliivibrio]OCH18164.1 transporter [Aliivibrio sp. 1S165]OCH35541.1 transporter [Aliivibrio sp. 1S175]